VYALEKSNMKVKYIGEDLVAMRTGKVYDVMAIEKGWYRIMTEIHDSYLFPPACFEIVDDEKPGEDKE